MRTAAHAAAKTSLPNKETPKPVDTRDQTPMEKPFYNDLQPVQFSFGKIAIQPKLKISQPGDISEQEADRTADAVVESFHGKPASPDQPASCIGCTIEKKMLDKGPPVSYEVSGSLATDIDHLYSHDGRPLDSQTRQFMEQRFGHDFSSVRIHADEKAARSAQAIDALAYTVGNDIVFDEGRYAPSSHEGMWLVAHELAHVVQQTGKHESTIQRKPPEQSSTKQGVTFWYAVRVTSPLDSDQLLLELVKQYRGIGDEEAQLQIKQANWHWIGTPQMASEKDVQKGYVLVKVTDRGLTPADAEAKKERKEYFGRLPSAEKAKINAEVDFQFWEKTNYKFGQKLGYSADDQKMAEYWLALRDELIRQRQEIESLPPLIKDFLFTKNAPQLVPQEYTKVLEIAKKLSTLSDAELADYKSKVTAKTTDWYEFASSIDRYLAERAERKKSLEEREKTKTKLYGLKDLYEKWKGYREIKRLASIPPPSGSIEGYESHEYLKERSSTLEEELTINLKRHNFDSIAAFEQAIRDYEATFEKESLAIALDLLAKYAHVLYEEEKKYRDPAKAAALHQKVGETQARKSYQEAESETASAWRAMPPAGAPSMPPGAAEHLKKAEEAKSYAQSEVKSAAGEHPLVATRAFEKKLKELAFASPEQTQTMMLEYIQSQKGDIAETRSDLIGDPTLVFKLDELFEISIKSQSIEPDSILDLIVRDRRKSLLRKEFLRKIAWAVVAIAIGLLTFGGGTVAMIAAGVTAAISTYQALEEFKEYAREQRFYDLELASDEPSFAWVVLAVVGAAVDLGAAASAVRAIRAAKVIEAFNEAGDIAKLEAKLSELAEVNARMRANIVKAAETQLQYENAVESLLSTGGQLRTVVVPGAEEFTKLVVIAYYSAKRGVIAFEKFLLELKAKRLIDDIAKLTPEQLTGLKKAFAEGVERSSKSLPPPGTFQMPEGHTVFLQPEGYVVGKVTVPQLPTPQRIGQEIEEPVRDLIGSRLGINFSSKSPSATGPDLIIPDDVRAQVGFDIADIKPLNETGVKKFWNQLDNWRDYGWQGGPSSFKGKAAMFGYDEYGNVYLYGIFDM